MMKKVVLVLLSFEPNASDDDFDFAVTPSFRTPNSALNKSRNVFDTRQDRESSNQIEITSCPVCNKNIPVTRINFHLDECLKEQNSGDSTAAVKNSMKPISASCLYALEDGELKSKALQYGLPIHGERKQLTKRIEEYILLYNSQCDSLNPMNASMIAKKVCENEQNLLKHGYVPSILIHTHDNRYSDKQKEELITKHAAANENHYRELIGEVKKRDLGKNVVVKTKGLSEEIDKNANDQLVIEIEDNTPEQHPLEATDHPEFGHVPDWFDPSLLKSNNHNDNKKRCEKSKAAVPAKTRKTSAKNKRTNVKCGDISSYFSSGKPKVSSDTPKVSSDTTENEHTKIEKFSISISSGEESLIDCVEHPITQKPPPCLVEDTDEEDDMIPCSRNLPPIDESDDYQEFTPESPSILEEDSSDLVAAQITIFNPADAVSSTTGMTEIQQHIPLVLSPISAKRKRCTGGNEYSSQYQPKSAEEDSDNSLNPYPNLSEEISCLVEKACKTSESDSSSSGNEFSPIRSKPLPDKTSGKKSVFVEVFEEWVDSQNVIPKPPSDSFEFD